MSGDGKIAFQELGGGGVGAAMEQMDGDKSAVDLAAVFDVPVNIQAVLGRAHLDVAQLLGLASGSVVELDRKVGEPIDIFVNNRLVARGEVVLVGEHLGVTMTEIIKDGDAA
jgi:flagellar motor switch protein FliN